MHYFSHFAMLRFFGGLLALWWLVFGVSINSTALRDQLSVRLKAKNVAGERVDTSGENAVRAAPSPSYRPKGALSQTTRFLDALGVPAHH
ncbi:hypothetical protein [uncultured Pseudomonas sp.]|uniref:hypothetical protein n=1 Tax=uncultured Pseudomonas sp. TaxID=114707 RepID=UPI0030DDD86B|tara:strand:- start:258 stop:527 length:270 start_codon:yes stop_codon:yes gene_type:complete